jgi:hypothetical protein
MTIKELLHKRANITNEIGLRWDIIIAENLMPIADRNNRTMDLMQAYNEIKKLADERVKVKLIIQCANMGMKMDDLDIKANVRNIYELTEFNELIVKLDSVKTVSKNIARRYGDMINVCDVLSEAFIKSEKHTFILAKNKLNAMLEEFNSKTLESLNTIES